MKTTVLPYNADGTGPLAILLDDGNGNKMQLIVDKVLDIQLQMNVNSPFAFQSWKAPPVEVVRQYFERFAAAMSADQADKPSIVDAE